MHARDRDPQAVPQPGLECELQRLVQLAAERCEHRQAELAGRVAKRLDEHGPVVGYDAGKPDLPRYVIAEGRVPRRASSVIFGLEPGEHAGLVAAIGQDRGRGADFRA